MHLILFIIVLFVAIIAVKIGAAAFEITGVNRETATFQALSCFTGCGFTTSESELIMRYPERRKIARILMVMGYAGLATFITSIVNSLSPGKVMFHFQIPIVDRIFRYSELPIVNLAIIILILILTYKLFANKKLQYSILGIIKTQLLKRKLININENFGVVAQIGGEYAIAYISVQKKNHLEGITISKMKEMLPEVNVLSVERNGKLILKPQDSLVLDSKDRPLIYCNIMHLQEYFDNIGKSGQ
jgi:hypothetical protein